MAPDPYGLLAFGTHALSYSFNRVNACVCKDHIPMGFCMYLLPKVSTYAEDTPSARSQKAKRSERVAFGTRQMVGV